MSKKDEFEKIVDEFEPLSELEESESVNGGSVFAYAIMPNTDAVWNIIRKFIVLPK